MLAARPDLKKAVAAVFFDPYSPAVSVPVSERKDDARPKRFVPVYDFPESAIAALAAAARYGMWRATPTGSLVEIKVDRDAAQRIAADHQSGWLPKTDVAALLATVGIRFTEAQVAPPSSAGIEVLAGIRNDPVFGPLVAFGSGGHLAELLDDVVFRVLPLTDRDAAEMIRSTRAYRLLTGYRGSAEADIAAVEDLLLRLGALAEAVPPNRRN